MQELDPGIGQCGVGDEVAVGNVIVGDERGEGAGFVLIYWCFGGIATVVGKL